MLAKASAHALEESTRLQTAASVEEATEAVTAAGAPTAQTFAAFSGDRPVEGDTVTSPTVTSPLTVITPSEAPAVASIIKVDETEPATGDEPELPEMVATYDAEVERPSAFEEASSTLLVVEPWSMVENQVAQAAVADLEEIRSSACAAEWQALLSKRRTPQVLQRAAGDRLVEGEPIVIQVADSGRLMQNTLRKMVRSTPRMCSVKQLYARASVRLCQDLLYWHFSTPCWMKVDSVLICPLSGSTQRNGQPQSRTCRKPHVTLMITLAYYFAVP